MRRRFVYQRAGGKIGECRGCCFIRFCFAKCNLGEAASRAHAGSRHHEGANAIVEIARLVDRMAGLTDYSRELTVNVGSIVGGGPLNRVPHLAECHTNIRASSFLEMGAIIVAAIRELVSI